MQMQMFITLLYNELKREYLELEFGFYVSRRNRYVHMGSDIALHKIKDYEKIIEKIKLLYYQKKTDDKFSFCEPCLIASMHWKYDYIIFSKNYYNDMLTSDVLCK